MTLAQPESYFVSSARFSELNDALQETTVLGDLDALNVVKVLTARWPVDPKKANLVLEKILNVNPSVMGRTLHGTSLLVTLADAILALQSDQDAAQGLTTLATAPTAHSSLVAQIPSLKNKLMVHVATSPARVLPALFVLPLSPKDITSICCRVRLIQAPNHVPAPILAKGIPLGSQWINVCVDSLAALVDDEETARLLLELVANINSVYVSLRFPDPEFKGMPISKSLLPVLKQALQQPLSLQTLGPLKWPDMPPHLLHYQRAIDQARAIKSARPGDWDADLAAVFPEMSSTGNLAADLADSFDGISPAAKLEVLEKLEAAASAEPQQGTNPEMSPEWLSIFTTICESPDLLTDGTLRLAACKALTAALDIWQPPFELSHDNIIGSWLVGCLKSSARDLRVQATRSIGAFVTARTGEEAKLGLFRFLTTLMADSSFETALLAWTEAAVVADSERLNMLLLRMIDVLGGPAFRAALAAHQLRAIAARKGITPWQLCAPFWATISVAVVRRLSEQDVLVARFCSLLGVSESDLLIRTCQYTLPDLTLRRQVSTVRVIADAVGCTTKKLYLDYAAPILSRLMLQQGVSLPVQFAEKRWRELDPGFATINFQGVIKSNLPELNFELLKEAPPEGADPSRESHIIKVINDLAHGEDALSVTMVYKLVNMFSDTMRNFRGRQPYTTKLQCLRGLDLLMRSSEKTVAGLVAQVSTFLQAALDIPELEAAAFQTWQTLAVQLGDVYNLVDLVFSVISQRWDKLSKAGQAAATELTNIIVSYPSFAKRVREKGTPNLPMDLLPASTQVTAAQAKTSPVQRLRDLVARSNQDNVYVIQQMVLELASFTANHQDIISKEMASPRGRELLGAAVRALLHICQRFPNRNLGIVGHAVQCLCFIGALDPTYFDIQPQDDNPVVVSNFEDGEESAKFAGYFVVNYLFKAYEASTDPNAQKFVLYGIQEYLKFCKLSKATSNSVRGRRRWDELIGHDLYDALSPLLSTKYVSPMAPLSTKEYPIFRGAIEYSAWLADFCSDLMCRVVGANAEEIFALCRRVVRDREQSIPVFTFMLPYVALNAVLANEDNRQVFLTELLTVLATPSSENDDVSAFHERIFAVLDYFGQWIRESRKSNRSNHVKIVETLLSEISPAAMAQRAFGCRSYPRALRYWEQSLREEQYGGPTGATAESVYEKMREMYAEMGDSDSLEGVSTKFAVMNLDQQILEHETLGRWNDALACYDVLGQWDINTQESRLQCLHSAGRDRELLARFTAMSTHTPEGAGLAASAAWQVSDLAALDHWSRATTGHSNILEGHVGRALLALRNNDQQAIARAVDSACTAAGAKLPPHVTSLAQIRRISVYLHGIGDVAQIASWNGASEPESPAAISHQNELRLARVGPDYASRSYLLSLRRAAFQASTLPTARHEIAETFYLAARDARKHGDTTLALANVLEAKRNAHSLAGKEHAKLLWSQGETRQAIKMLRDEVDPLFLESVSAFGAKKVSMETAKTALLYTTWLDQAGQMHSQDLILWYSAISKASSNWEKASYMLAKHVTRVYHAQLQLPENSRSPSYYDGTLTMLMVRNFAQSLEHGSKYVSESLPKLLTLWLDFASNVTLPAGLPRNLLVYNAVRQANLKRINDALEKHASQVPGYLWYLGVPQLLSRITQQDGPVYKIMKTLIVRVVRMYPHQALWSIVEVTNCSPSQEKRRARGQDILKSLLNTPESRSQVRTLVPPALALVKALRTICCYQRGKERLPPILKLSQIDVDLSSVPCPLVVPVQKYLTCILPEQKAGIRHSPFPFGPEIYSIDNEANVQNSLQQPKRLNVWGTDGLKYMLLCKGTDDVRKDARLIEFSTTINRLLEGDPEATTRHLNIAAYRVTPIDEASGVIEWVDGAQPIRHIIEKNLAARGIKMHISDARKALGEEKDTQVRTQKFLAVCQKYPPVLYDWFISTFPDPEAWLRARARYARSTAVMSMVGYILGLGDRHLENLLLLQDSGTLLHVDFDCLFDKGATFKVPEVVPFRLTQNMVDALGVYSYEGPFRKACEITLGLLRNNEELLMTVLEPFLYDPVVGPSKDRGPEKSLEAIRDKLRGIRFKDSAPFSVPGQVEDLIQQAVSPANLSSMYLGWGAFL